MRVWNKRYHPSQKFFDDEIWFMNYLTKKFMAAFKVNETCFQDIVSLIALNRLKP